MDQNSAASETLNLLPRSTGAYGLSEARFLRVGNTWLISPGATGPTEGALPCHGVSKHPVNKSLGFVALPKNSVYSAADQFNLLKKLILKGIEERSRSDAIVKFSYNSALTAWLAMEIWGCLDTREVFESGDDGRHD
ncbi:hypothetical protein [Rhizobium sp. RU36D]|uniref:hypothetical protein n=1 Tax=Rhizobium sp. RU36D TaxID=1907415 RepID=UPI00117B3700|nr:hypothetical protein [Rhizobium sp. RU36D]